MAAQSRKARFRLEAFLAEIAGKGATRTFDRNQVILRQGDPGSDVFYILSGRIILTIVSGKGKEAVLAIIGPGQFFGMRNLFDDQHRFATTTALTRCSVLRIGKSAILRALREEPRFAEAFVFFLLDAIGRVEVSLLDQLLNSSEQRLARILLHLADPDGEGRFEPISPEISQQTLAEMVGTTRARINSFMNKFRRLGLIDYNGHLEVREALRKFVQE